MEQIADFKSAIFVPFEDTKMPIPVDYKRYLTQVFGDYMQLPPEEDRQPHHEALIVDAKKSYTEYLKKYIKDENNRLKICFHLFTI